ncbi:hypothetical protein SAMN05216228_104016 [Rhizobium tibeticum]|uniref:Uncharacterized protein n=1 Tax=Rhizobium tibeticum TaxID=501024 RepID=A0A1H8V8C8_9HYPH|nr:hypothetical protein RTCCBAU85039_5937 [Rhizobium tibeticum]SEP11710.1 hypothetical protein SAMN05216228_104016 [Rhizobium tibeticum]
MLQRHVLSLAIGVGLTSACLLFVEPLAAADQEQWPSTKAGAAARESVPMRQ